MTRVPDLGHPDGQRGADGQSPIREEPGSTGSRRGADLPLVSVVFLAHNRRDQLLYAVDQMLSHSGYPDSRLEVLVVDNASDDGTAEAIAERLPSVRLVCNKHNLGASGWNAGFALAQGKYILILDDDAYLRPGDLERAVRAAERERAGLVSFSVVSLSDGQGRFNDDWPTGLLSYWGCAALVSREAVTTLGGYDSYIFIWANEVEFTMRLLDRGFRHLHLPDIHAVHMKERDTRFKASRYLINARHHGYIVGKLMRPVDIAVVILNLMQEAAVQAVREDPVVVEAVKEILVGCCSGLRRRTPVRSAVSTAYRRNFHAFAGPWPFTRSVRERLASRGEQALVATQRTNRHARYYRDRAKFYPTGPASLQL